MTAHVVLGLLSGPRGTRCSVLFAIAAVRLTSRLGVCCCCLQLCTGTGPRQPTHVKPRADPKTFFANERTFLQWLQICEWGSCRMQCTN